MMKKFALIFLSILCLIVFTGGMWYDSPVLPSKNFYVNDHAGVISGEYRDFMLEAARSLYYETQVQLVVLTVESLGDRKVEEYSDAVFKGWRIGGEGQDGILMLVSTGDGEAYILLGGGVSGMLSDQESEDIKSQRMVANFAQGDYSAGVHDGFLAIADKVYEHLGIEPRYGAELKPVEKKDSGIWGSGAVIIVVAAIMFVVLRAFRTGLKYRRKYGSNNAPYLRKLPQPTRVRYDGGDYPSGFGGLGTIDDFDDPEDETTGGDKTSGR